MKQFPILTLTLLVLHATGQTLIHSKPEVKDFDRFRFHIITRNDNRLVVYKAVYFNTTANAGPLLLHSAPGGSIIESDICVYDSLMEQVSETRLTLPKEISGTDFIVYDDFFYLFYQYLRGHNVYCMAAKVDFNGRQLGSPVCLDSTHNVDFNYQSQIYAVINSEDRQRIMVFKLNGGPTTGTILSTALFDSQLHELHRTNHGINLKGGEYLSEFHLDDKGNLLFVGLSHTLDRGKPENAILFNLKPVGDSLDYAYVLSGTVYLDDVHLLIDNTRDRYILSSFYTPDSQGDVEGVFLQIRDAAGTRPARTTFTILSDSLRRAVHDRGKLRKVFNDYYVQSMHLLADGSFTIETQELVQAPEPTYYNRWNHIPYRGIQRVGSNFLFYDAWEKDHYFPWNDWRLVDLPGFHSSTVSFISSTGLVARFDPTGIIKWINRFTIPQRDIKHDRLGYTSIVADGRLYFIYNETIRNKQFLSGQCIDAGGELNTDTRFKEDHALAGQSSDYSYYPRLAEQVGADELIIPCQKGRQVCLVRLRL